MEKTCLETLNQMHFIFCFFDMCLFIRIYAYVVDKQRNELIHDFKQYAIPRNLNDLSIF